MGGYSSMLFHLLYRFSPELRTEFERSDEHRWIQRYGFEEVTVGKDDDDAVEDGRNSRRRKFRKVVRERPGLVPSALFHIIGNTVFLRLSDVASGLPPYDEQILLSSMDSEQDATGYSQRSAYTTVYEELRLKLAEALKAGSKRLLATYLQTLLAYPEGCTKGETVFDPRSGDVIVQVPPLSEEKLYPKEQALVDLVAAERMESRRVLVYATHTGTRDITERMEDILTRHGFRVAVMKADAVAPDKREAWVADRVKQGIDVMICHPRLVQTSLDLIDFPTLCWFETDYSVYVMRQASRRSWRIGQTRPVKVVFMAYRNTLQADALKLVAKKLQSSLAVEGELPEDGLAAYGDDGDDLMMALARRIVSGDEEDEAETVEEVFAQARDAEASAEEYLVDDDWKVVEVEPEAVNGNGHHDDGIGPTVDLVLGNGRLPVNGNGTNRESLEASGMYFLPHGNFEDYLLHEGHAPTYVHAIEQLHYAGRLGSYVASRARTDEDYAAKPLEQHISDFIGREGETRTGVSRCPSHCCKRARRIANSRLLQEDIGTGGVSRQGRIRTDGSRWKR